jgi:hypothetical protein
LGAPRNGEGSLKSISKSHDVTHKLLIIWIDEYRRDELPDEIDFNFKEAVLGTGIR